MNMVRCPNCYINLTPAESKAPNCPVCGDSLDSLNNRTFDPPRPPSTAADARPSYNSHQSPAEPETTLPQVRTTTSSSRTRSGGGGGALWWVVIPILLVAVRGGLMLLKLGSHSSPTPSTYSQPIDELRQEVRRPQMPQFDSDGESISSGAVPQDPYAPFNDPTSGGPSRYPRGFGGSQSPSYNPGAPGGSSPSVRPYTPRPNVPRPSVPRPGVPQPGVPRPSVPRPGMPSGPSGGFGS